MQVQAAKCRAKAIIKTAQAEGNRYIAKAQEEAILAISSSPPEAASPGRLSPAPQLPQSPAEAQIFLRQHPPYWPLWPHQQTDRQSPVAFIFCHEELVEHASEMHQKLSCRCSQLAPGKARQQILLCHCPPAGPLESISSKRHCVLFLRLLLGWHERRSGARASKTVPEMSRRVAALDGS